MLSLAVLIELLRLLGFLGGYQENGTSGLREYGLLSQGSENFSLFCMETFTNPSEILTLGEHMVVDSPFS